MKSKSTPRSLNELALGQKKSFSQVVKSSISPKLTKQATIRNFLNRNAEKTDNNSSKDRHHHCNQKPSEEPFAEKFQSF